MAPLQTVMCRFATPPARCAATPTWTGNFAPTTFYDGQGVMVQAKHGIHLLEDPEGNSVCVAVGTT